MGGSGRMGVKVKGAEEKKGHERAGDRVFV